MQFSNSNFKMNLKPRMTQIQHLLIHYTKFTKVLMLNEATSGSDSRISNAERKYLYFIKSKGKALLFLMMYKYLLEAVDQTKSIHAKTSSKLQETGSYYPSPFLIFLSLVSCSFFIILSFFLRFTAFSYCPPPVMHSVS